MERPGQSPDLEAEEERSGGSHPEVGREAESLAAAAAAEEKRNPWRVVIAYTICIFASLYMFLVGLQLMGDAFKCLGGRGAGSLFTAVQNPIMGLMTGVLATVMVQSSSTTTSIVVGLVGADQISVRAAIPIIMGANIGTSVTNTIVSMGQAGVRLELQRAFAGATVHDMFNLLSVACLLPLEIIVGAIQGQGGPLFWLTEVLTNAIMGSAGQGGGLFESPIKVITGPVSKLIIANNKHIIHALSLGEPVARTPEATNSSSCLARLLSALPREPHTAAVPPAVAGEALRGQAVDCSRFYCVSSVLDKAFKKIDKKSYKTELTGCAGYILAPAPPCTEGEKCYLDAGDFFRTHVVENRIIKGGFTEGMGDVPGGVLALVISLLLLVAGLCFLTRSLKVLMSGMAKRVIFKATNMNDYLAMLIGVGLTILVQSSSVTTSALTPFCGLGILSLEKMLPLSLGANIGTTVTAFLAAIATFTSNAVHIALCHFFFNVFGILIWFPIPFMRRVPLGAARLLGLYASYYRLVPLIYILVVFVAIPGVCLGISAMFNVSLAGGIVVLAVVLLIVAAFEFWWIRLGGSYRVLSETAREKAKEKLKQAMEEFTPAVEPAVQRGASATEPGAGRGTPNVEPEAPSH